MRVGDERLLILLLPLETRQVAPDNIYCFEFKYIYMYMYFGNYSDCTHQCDWWIQREDFNDWLMLLSDYTV